MALTKIGKEGITGISNASDATFLTATSGEGVTLAGTLAVTGVHTIGTNAVATVGSVTTSVADGLVTTYCKWAEDATVIIGLNVTSITDTGLGDWTINIANDYASTHYINVCQAFSSFQTTMCIAVPNTVATGSCQVYGINTAGSNKDITKVLSINGDLA